MGKPKFRVCKPYVGRRKNINLCRRMKKSEDHHLLGQGDGGTKLESATARKFQAFGVMEDLFSKTSEEMDMTANDSDDSFFVIQRSCLQKLFEKLSCPYCGIVGTLMIAILDCLSFGLSIKIKLQCSSCNEVCIEDFMCSRLGKSTSSRVPFEVNIRAVLAFRSIGCGFSGLKDWCDTMNMPSCMSYDTFATSQSRIQQASKDTFCKLLETTRSSVQSAYNDIGVLPDEEGILNIAVSFDGTWQRRGHSSHNGVATVIDLLTGLPLDFEVLSNFCLKCKLEEGNDPSNEWKKQHAAKCLKNFDGSANAMEVESAVRMWKRSVQKNGMRYTSMLCDGDSKSFDAVSREEVYGPSFPIEKEDCVNHVSKRMGTALRNLVAEAKAQGSPISGKGKLTQPKIIKIQNYYGRAIKDHFDDIEVLKKRIFAILLHLSSTDAFPKHQQCPAGEKSWCFWQRANAKNEKPNAHKDHETIPPDVGKKLVPIFQRLADERLLKRCQRNKTQNPNESLHQLIWKLAPKAIYTGKNTLETAVTLALCQFSMGRSFQHLLCNLVGFDAGKFLQQNSISADKKRLKKAEIASSFQAKKRRKELKFSRAVKDQNSKEKEGPTYSAGAFN